LNDETWKLNKKTQPKNEPDMTAYFNARALRNNRRNYMLRSKSQPLQESPAFLECEGLPSQLRRQAAALHINPSPFREASREDGLNDFRKDELPVFRFRMNKTLKRLSPKSFFENPE
jgi:hypothetical protein